MKFTFITIFPDIIEQYTSSSIFGRSREIQHIEVETVNIRNFADGAYKQCDDAPYGGGSGMVLLPEPLDKALCSVKTNNSHVVFATPAAPLLTHNDARRLSKKKEIIFLCGRYEGIDQRIIDMHVHEVFSIGEYVVSSGELASLVIADAIHRLVDGVITTASLVEESYENGLLEYPHYTRPAVFAGRAVPNVLLSGNHQHIQAWRKEQQCSITQRYRPDLYASYLHDIE